MEDKEMSIGFEHGVLWAVARIVELHDEPTIAGDILRESGVDWSKADEYDLPYLRIAVGDKRASVRALKPSAEGSRR